MFVDAEVRLGRATHARLLNCNATFNGGDAVPALFSNPVASASVGSAGMYARSPRITCAASVACCVEVGQAVTVDHPAASAPYYVVAQRLPDELHTGMATFLLSAGPRK